jgi:hypothetical protein
VAFFVLLLAALGDRGIKQVPPVAVGVKVKHLPVLWSEFKISYRGKVLSLRLPEDSRREPALDPSLPIVFQSEYYLVELSDGRLDDKLDRFVNNDRVPTHLGSFEFLDDVANQKSEAYGSEYQSVLTAEFFKAQTRRYLQLRVRCVSPVPDAQGDFNEMCRWIGKHN